MLGRLKSTFKSSSSCSSAYQVLREPRSRSKRQKFNFAKLLPDLQKLILMELSPMDLISFLNAFPDLLSIIQTVKDPKIPITISIGKFNVINIRLQNGTETDFLLTTNPNMKCDPSYTLMVYPGELHEHLPVVLRQLLATFPTDHFVAYFDFLHVRAPFELLHGLSGLSFEKVVIEDEKVFSVMLKMVVENLTISDVLKIDGKVKGEVYALEQFTMPSLDIVKPSWLTIHHLTMLNCSKINLYPSHDHFTHDHFLQFIHHWLRSRTNFQLLHVEFDCLQESLPYDRYLLDDIGAWPMGRRELNEMFSEGSMAIKKRMVVGFHIRRRDGVRARLIFRPDAMSLVTQFFRV